MFLLISTETGTEDEARVLNTLFEQGLPFFLLRLPHKEIRAYVRYLEHIMPKYRTRVFVADFHLQLAEKFPLAGFYCSRHALSEYLRLREQALERRLMIGAGIHQLSELPSDEKAPHFALLSPVFNSISKQGYAANTELLSLGEKCRESKCRILAMGGVTPQNIASVYKAGYDGAAVIGSVWTDGSSSKALSNYLSFPQNRILSVAGIDPSGGAGLLADAKIAANLSTGLTGAPSAFTIQSAEEVSRIDSLPLEDILANIQINLRGKNVRVGKIGMCQTTAIARAIALEMKKQLVKFIIWDPILKTTAGEHIVMKGRQGLEDTLPLIDLLTPNLPEADAFFSGHDDTLLQEKADKYKLHILLKGGHRQNQFFATDKLFIPKRKKPVEILGPFINRPKHGTGCMLSASIAVYISRGHSVENSCRLSKQMMTRILQSDDSLLARFPVNPCLSKKNRLKNHYLQYVTHEEEESRLLTCCEKALESGIRWIQLRLKNATTEKRIVIGRKIKKLCQQHDATFIMNDDLEAAIGCDADGAHLGLKDASPIYARKALGADKIIGCTCNEEKHILKAYQAGADYIGLGPFRFTITKENLSPILGSEGLIRLIRYNNSLPFPMPYVSIGGITANDILAMRSKGIKGFALSGAIEKEHKISENVANILSAFRQTPTLTT